MSPAAKLPDKNSYAGRFAARLRALRNKSGLSVEDVVAVMQKAGYPISVQTYYGWENGKRQANLDAIPAIAKAFELKPRELLPVK